MTIDPTALAQYGLSGVCIALILLLGWLMKLGLNFVAHALNKNTEALQSLINVIEKLTDKIETWRQR